MTNPLILTTTVADVKQLVSQDGTTIPAIPQPAGSATTVTLSGPDVTGSGPASAVPTNLSLTVTTVPGGATQQLTRARFNFVLLEGPDCTIPFPAAPLSGDVVALSWQYLGNVGIGAPPTTLEITAPSTAPLEVPTAPGTYANTVEVIDGTAKLFYVFDQSGENQWSLVASNIALAGFVGDLSQSANGATQQTTWFIDPANSTGTASDSNSGVGSGVALLSFREVVRRWGSKNPVLNQATTINYLSSAANTDVIDVQAKGTGALTFIGPGTAGTVFFTGAISGHTPYAASGTPESIAAYAGAAVGQMVVNTTRGNSRCFVLQIAEGTAVLSQPMAASTPGSPGAPNTAWANGDTIEVFVLPTVYLTLATFDPDAFTTPGGIVFQNLNFGGELSRLGGYVAYAIECSTTSETGYLAFEPTGFIGRIYNGQIGALKGGAPANPNQSNGPDGLTGIGMWGGGVGNSSASSVDTFYANQNVTISRGGDHRFFSSVGGAILLANAALNVSGGAFILSPIGGAGAGSGGSILNMTCAGRCMYTSTATLDFLNIQLQLNGNNNGLSRLSTAGTYAWFGNITLSPANLDASPASTTAFNGLAFSSTGSACFAAAADS